jgi:hypothetical protein
MILSKCTKTNGDLICTATPNYDSVFLAPIVCIIMYNMYKQSLEGTEMGTGAIVLSTKAEFMNVYCTVLLRFLGIILRVLRLEVSVWIS